MLIPDPDLDFSAHPGSRIRGSKRHRIPDPQHWLIIFFSPRKPKAARKSHRPSGNEAKRRRKSREMRRRRPLTQPGSPSSATRQRPPRKRYSVSDSIRTSQIWGKYFCCEKKFS
jgi:hypothetical protein